MPSRIIVKNLPKYLDTDRFRDIFSAVGDITDIKIMQTQSGKSRQFGFVGYRSEGQAEEAVKHFNKSFIDTFRIVVELAVPYGDSNTPRPWSRYSKNAVIDSAAEAQKQAFEAMQKSNENAVDELKKKHLASLGIGTEDSNEVGEFLEIMKSRNQRKAWENDDITAGAGVIADQLDESKMVIPTVKLTSNENDDLYDDMPALKTSSENNEEHQEVIKQQPIASHQDEKDDIEPIPDKEKINVDILTDTGRIFARNLPFTVTEQELTELFSKYGPLSEVHIPIDRESKKPRGIAYVAFMIPEHAVLAFTELDMTIFQGRLLHLLPSREKRVVEIPENHGSAFKNKKQQKLKSNASDESTWNSLFMNANTVAEAMARNLDVSKSELLDPEADGMAVKMALAETHIIEETVKYLAQEGVCVDSFKQNMAKQRSDTIIMVKNLPFNVDEKELKEMFSRHGDVIRLVLPPSRAIALIEYLAANEAKAAFRSLAYKNFKGRPLLLEMAPMGTFKVSAEKASLAQNNADEPDKKEVVSQILEEANDFSHETSTLFVKNLNFSTTNEEFASVFQQIDGFRSAKVSTKKNIKTGQIQSMGFGFVEFNSKESAVEAMKRLQNYILNDHSMQIKLSDRTSSRTSSKTAGKEIKAKGTKLLIRNVPFEATKKDITDLFGTYGQLKRVRLPKKFDNKSHRGFAFIDFLTKQEAKNAFESLANTHLYGRHLVIEWAEDQDSIDAIRDKTKRIYDTVAAAAEEVNPRKRIVLGGEEGGSDTEE